MWQTVVREERVCLKRFSMLCCKLLHFKECLLKYDDGNLDREDYKVGVCEGYCPGK